MADPVKEKLVAVLGTWGRPPDVPAKVALALAALLALGAVFGRGRSLFGLRRAPAPRKTFLWITAFGAALLSILYIGFYLRGGPRIIDATTYYLQGRALSEGSFTWPVPEPSASFRGRFLVYRDGAMGGIFPPGYPLLLALGFALGAPMVVGPAIAAALVLATHRLARTIAEQAAVPAELIEPVARAAALLSLLSAALRYHTADTMSHGATALGVALALDAALRGRAGLAGLAVGFVAATRPLSAIGVAAGALWLLRSDRRLIARAALGAAPGLLLLVLAQRAVTGAWLASSQRMYYTMSDGPPGCFRWGFGAGTGCVHEHEEFVRARLPRGYGIAEAAGTTLRRVRMHLTDVANLEPIAFLPLALLRARARGAGVALAVILIHVLAYAPFYFDGNYPGGGARLFAELLPIEHALAAVAVARLASFLPLRVSRSASPLRVSRSASPLRVSQSASPLRVSRSASFPRGALALLSLSALGFAVHASYDHEQLAARDGGRPMYEPDLLSRQHITAGLVFVDTDHGFGLAHDPAATTKTGLVVARRRDDDRDWLLFDRLDRPPTWSYKLDRAADPAQGVVVPWAPPQPGAEGYRFEADAEWPVLSQSGAFAVPRFVDGCASQSRALVVTPDVPGGNGDVTIALPVPSPGRWSVSVRIVHDARLRDAGLAGEDAKGVVRLGPETWEWPARGGGCLELLPREVELAGQSALVVIGARRGPIVVDKLTLASRPK